MQLETCEIQIAISLREIVCLGCNSCGRDSNASAVINRIGLGHIHDGNKWAGSGHKTLDEAIHDELSTTHKQLSLF